MFIILFFKIPNIENNNYILHKLIIFALLFMYQFILLILSNIKNNCKINVSDVFKSSLETATIGIIGYSIYTDLQFAQLGDFDAIYLGDENMKYLYVTIIVTLLLTFVNTIKLLFGFTPYECIKYE